MLRWGVLSTAKIGREHVIPAICAADDNVLSAVASRDAEAARTLADRFGAPHAFSSYEALLDSDQVDAVYIPLPTAMHVEWAEKSARAGKHVLCEKPIALKASEIDRLIATRDETGVLISEAFMVTYHPQWHKVRELIEGGAIGTLRQVDAAFTYFNRDAGNMRNVPELGGGVIPDIAVYPTVTTRFATGKEPQRISATVDFDPGFGTDRYASVRADYGSFEQSFYISTQMAQRQTIAFHGDKGFIELTAPWNSNLYEGDEVRLHNQDHRKTDIFRYTGIDQYRLEIEAFGKAIETGEREPIFSLEDSVKNQRVIDAIYRAGEEGGWVEV
ncbi:Gfo/Idh/MocA family protein [Notoacmeibacter sp. MSK16QG-6]|uniref:Gfo/Idh/MocA family protein n=1 Tax=Notoacmeibacter sp. MSK16QG-6 TaxID=2957982 RepID=UPI0020A21408|nr:Gfo/Idh/MocA family oxidoreductase [Notoacmeibacter sp. MSK16QG-6]MCP1198930.1 Gfo/Idh/MocA family oxidoreductase [Notoacmeibacter sp. MSK16QG-6]